MEEHRRVQGGGGTALVRTLVADGQRVIVLSRDARRAAAGFGPAVTIVETLDALPGERPIRAIVNLAGAPILGGRWSRTRKAVLLDSRIGVTRALHGLVSRLDQRPAVLVSASAVGLYGARNGGEEIDETAPAQPGAFQSDLCAAWEAEADTMRALGLRVVRLRFAAVLGRSGGVLPALSAASRCGLGAVLGQGSQPMPWVHLDDAVAAIRCAMENPCLAGAVNVVAPEGADQAGFAHAIAAAGRARVYLTIPAALIRALGGEASTILLDGQAATPRCLLSVGFRFRHPTLAGALTDLASRASAGSEGAKQGQEKWRSQPTGGAA